VTTDRRLIDRDYGECTCQNKQSVVASWGSVDAAPGVEPRSAVRDRAMQALADIARRANDRAVAVVSHVAVTREVLVAADPGLGDPDDLPQDNGCFNPLEWQSGQWAVRKVNELPAQA
jgi:broad specificity phosphatase PhoE